MFRQQFHNLVLFPLQCKLERGLAIVIFLVCVRTILEQHACDRYVPKMCCLTQRGIANMSSCVYVCAVLKQ